MKASNILIKKWEKHAIRIEDDNKIKFRFTTESFWSRIQSEGLRKDE